MTPNKEMILQTDASIKGLGACLLQQGNPVHLTSKALTETQKGYVVIELELLAVVWAMEKFHHFLYSTHFILETDQKSLEAILLKSLNQTTSWLQRVLIQTFPYHFAVCHIPGPMNQLANCLSRLGLHQSTKTTHLPDYQSIKGQECKFEPTPYSNPRRWQTSIIGTHNYKWMA